MGSARYANCSFVLLTACKRRFRNNMYCILSNRIKNASKFEIIAMHMRCACACYAIMQAGNNSFELTNKSVSIHILEF